MDAIENSTIEDETQLSHVVPIPEHEKSKQVVVQDDTESKVHTIVREAIPKPLEISRIETVIETLAEEDLPQVKAPTIEERLE